MNTAVSNSTLNKLPLPDKATFGPEVTGQYDGHDIEFCGAGWYGLARYTGEQYYFWRKFTPDVRAGESEEEGAWATARSLGLTAPTWIS